RVAARRELRHQDSRRRSRPDQDRGRRCRLHQSQPELIFRRRALTEPPALVGVGALCDPIPRPPTAPRSGTRRAEHQVQAAMSSSERRRIVITGIGLIAPMGIGVEENWARIRAGESGIGPITRFDTTEYPTKIAGEVRNFDATKWIPKKLLRQMDIFIQYAVAASFECMESAGLTPGSFDPERFGR